jgi:hypothetical protein
MRFGVVLEFRIAEVPAKPPNRFETAEGRLILCDSVTKRLIIHNPTKVE